MQFEVNARMVALQEMPKRAIGAEIGVHKGAFTQKILNVANPTKLYAIDPFIYVSAEGKDQSLYGGPDNSQALMDDRHDAVVKRFAAPIAKGTLILMRDTSVKASAGIADATLDFVYIDGDHSYEGVKNDLDAFFPKMKAGGLMFGDDYSNNTSWWKDGVMRAFHEFIGHNARSLKIDFMIDGQICLQKL